jgi:hypothetical protein
MYGGEPYTQLLDTLDPQFGSYGQEPVDVLVSEGTSKEEAIAALKRITAYLEANWDRLTDPERAHPELYS